jgi:hypothetical protein
VTITSVLFPLMSLSRSYESRTSCYCMKANISASRISIVSTFIVVCCNINRYIHVACDANQSNLQNMTRVHLYYNFGKFSS